MTPPTPTPSVSLARRLRLGMVARIAIAMVTTPTPPQRSVSREEEHAGNEPQHDACMPTVLLAFVARKFPVPLRLAAIRLAPLKLFGNGDRHARRVREEKATIAPVPAEGFLQTGEIGPPGARARRWPKLIGIPYVPHAAEIAGQPCHVLYELPGQETPPLDIRKRCVITNIAPTQLQCQKMTPRTTPLGKALDIFQHHSPLQMQRSYAHTLP